MDRLDEDLFVSLQSSFKTLPFAARCVIIGFGLAGLAALLFAIPSQASFDAARVIALAVLSAAAARAKVTLYRGSTISFLTSVVLVAVMTEGPLVAMLIGICGVSVQTVFPSRRPNVYQLLFNNGMIAITVGATFWVYQALTGLPVLNGVSSRTTATILASCVYFLGNSVSVSLIVAVTKKLSMFQIWTQHFMHSAPSFVIAGVLARVVVGLPGSPLLLVASALLLVVGFVYYCSIHFSSLTAREEAARSSLDSAA